MHSRCLTARACLEGHGMTMTSCVKGASNVALICTFSPLPVRPTPSHSPYFPLFALVPLSPSPTHPTPPFPHSPHSPLPPLTALPPSPTHPTLPFPHSRQSNGSA
ncbi:unnamed protein product [Closterium sp. Naga37s-1]|nr:unnamed protein product [Closterium sp. Naga37s-1]